MKGLTCTISRKFYTIFLLSFAVLFTLLNAGNASAISGKVDLFTAYNNYFYLYINNYGARSWDSNYFGQTITTSLNWINGFTFTVDLSGPTYGNYTSGYIEYTLEADGNWIVDGGDLSNNVCEVWSEGIPTQITSNSRILNSYYQSGSNSYAVDIRCNYQATNLKPSYAYLRIGHASSSTEYIPIMDCLYHVGEIPDQTSHSCRPRVRNVSFSYNTTDEGHESAQLDEINQSIQDVGDTLEKQYEQDQQDRQDLQNLQSDGEDSAEASASQLNSGATRLLDIITAFFNFLISPPAGNCKIDADMGHMDLGEIDLCQLDPPPVIGVVGTVVLFGFGFTLAVSCLYSMLKLFEGVMTT